MGVETSVLSPHKTIFATSQSCKVVDNSSLMHEEEEKSWSCDLSVFLIGYFQHILCKQAKLWDVSMKTVLVFKLQHDQDT